MSEVESVRYCKSHNKCSKQESVRPIKVSETERISSASLNDVYIGVLASTPVGEGLKLCSLLVPLCKLFDYFKGLGL